MLKRRTKGRGAGPVRDPLPDQLGTAADGDDYFCRFTEMFWLPIALFGKSSFVDDGQDRPRVVERCERLGAMSAERVGILHAKLIAHWTRLTE